jgi:hypothetical protein
LSQAASLNKTRPSAFHVPNTHEKTTVQTRLSNVTVLKFSPYPRRRGLLGSGHVFENITPVPGT